MDTEKLCRLFMHKVLAALKAKNLISNEAVAQILSQQHSGFSAWLGERVLPDDALCRQFLGRYIDRGPVANSKISLTDDIVTYETAKDNLTHEFDHLEFLARLTPHIPLKWEQTTRYFGYYSSRARGERMKSASEESALIIDSDTFDQRKASRTWAALIKKVFVLDPLICPKCGGSMKIVAFITDHTEVARIMKNLGIEKFKPPPKIVSPQEDYPLAA